MVCECRPTSRRLAKSAGRRSTFEGHHYQFPSGLRHAACEQGNRSGGYLRLVGRTVQLTFIPFLVGPKDLTALVGPRVLLAVLIQEAARLTFTKDRTNCCQHTPNIAATVLSQVDYPAAHRFACCINVLHDFLRVLGV